MGSDDCHYVHFQIGMNCVAHGEGDDYGFCRFENCYGRDLKSYYDCSYYNEGYYGIVYLGYSQRNRGYVLNVRHTKFVIPYVRPANKYHFLLIVILLSENGVAQCRLFAFQSPYFVVPHWTLFQQ